MNDSLNPPPAPVVKFEEQHTPPPFVPLKELMRRLVETGERVINMKDRTASGFQNIMAEQIYRPNLNTHLGTDEQGNHAEKVMQLPIMHLFRETLEQRKAEAAQERQKIGEFIYKACKDTYIDEQSEMPLARDLAGEEAYPTFDDPTSRTFQEVFGELPNSGVLRPRIAIYEEISGKRDGDEAGVVIRSSRSNDYVTRDTEPHKKTIVDWIEHFGTPAYPEHLQDPNIPLIDENTTDLLWAGITNYIVPPNMASTQSDIVGANALARHLKYPTSREMFNKFYDAMNESEKILGVNRDDYVYIGPGTSQAGFGPETRVRIQTFINSIPVDVRAAFTKEFLPDIEYLATLTDKRPNSFDQMAALQEERLEIIQSIRAEAEKENNVKIVALCDKTLQNSRMVLENARKKRVDTNDTSVIDTNATLVPAIEQ